jgi:hypothetical protein
MSHPSHLLADYVDGALGHAERAEVEAHLPGCAVCRDEVRLARAGKRALSALASPSMPTRLAQAAIAEGERIAAERAPEVAPISGSERRRPNAPRWLALAGAAATIAVIALVGPKLGQAPNQATEAAGAKGATYPRATAVEIQDANYTFEGLPSAAEALRADYAYATANGANDLAAPDVPAPTTLSSSAPAAFSGERYSVERLPAATSCLDEAFKPVGALARVILARYQGQPAYFGVYLIGPGAGLPPTSLQLDVASVHGCQVLGTSTARL